MAEKQKDTETKEPEVDPEAELPAWLKSDFDPSSLKYKEFDFSDEKKVPNDGDLCAVKVFDSSRGKNVLGGLAIFDAQRNVFFQNPERDDTGTVTSCPVGTRRDNYKAMRVRDVVAYSVLDKDHDPAPEADSIIDHRNALQHASDKPPQVKG